MKISIIGYSGSGKSTLAKRLSMHYQLPLLYLDSIHFGPNWISRKDHLMEADIQTFMKQEQWIIEGQYRRHVPERFDEATQIYILELNRIKCLYNAIKRRFKYHNKTRESIAEGCNEKFDLSFFWWLIYKGRKKARKMFYQDLKSRYPQKTYAFKTHRKLTKHLKSLGINKDLK